MTEPDTVRNGTRPAAGPEDTPGRPTELATGSWLAAGRRTLAEFKNDFLQDRAAALTYYGVQAIFPGVLVLVSVLGLLGRSAANSLISNLGDIAPGTLSK